MLIFNSASTTVVDFSVLANDFKGGGNYIYGPNYSQSHDADIRVFGNTGIDSNTPYGFLTYKANASATTVTVAGTYYKAAGTNTKSSPSTMFSITNNRLTYLSSTTRSLDIILNGNATTNQNGNILSIAVVKNGNTAARVEDIDLTVQSANTYYTFALNTVAENAVQNDYFEIFVTNKTAARPVTIKDMQFRISDT